MGSLNLCLMEPDSLQKKLAYFLPAGFEKTSKMWSDFDVLGQRQNIPIFWHVLDVFSGQGDRIEPIPFAMSQAS